MEKNNENCTFQLDPNELNITIDPSIDKYLKVYFRKK